MKLFNVSVQITISDLGELRESQETPSLTDHIDFSGDPLKAQAQLLENFVNKSATATVAPPRYYPGCSDSGMSMAETVKIVASSFEELQAILKKFHDTAQSISAEAIR